MEVEKYTLKKLPNYIVSEKCAYYPERRANSCCNGIEDSYYLTDSYYPTDSEVSLVGLRARDDSAEQALCKACAASPWLSRPYQIQMCMFAKRYAKAKDANGEWHTLCGDRVPDASAETCFRCLVTGTTSFGLSILDCPKSKHAHIDDTA